MPVLHSRGGPGIQPMTRGWGGGGVSVPLNVKKKSQNKFIFSLPEQQIEVMRV